MKIRRILPALLLVCVLGGGLLAGEKVYSMYGNLWETLEVIEEHTENTRQSLAGMEDELNVIRHTTDENLRQYMDRAEQYAFDYSWTEECPPLIAHSMGGIDEINYTNSLEAFENSYDNGFRVFEVDLSRTGDDLLMCAHDDIEDGAGFLQGRILEKYTPLDYRGLIDLMAEYPDIYVITDTKSSEKRDVLADYAQIVRYAETTHPETLDRLIPQFYTQSMLGELMNIYPFRSVIFTLYQMKKWTPEDILDFCQKTGVGFITVPNQTEEERDLSCWHEAGIVIAEHTINGVGRRKELAGSGIYWLYTDFLTP